MDDQLSRLISDAVSDVEPTDRLVEIRERTRPRRTRTGWFAVGGAMLAAAAAVTAIAVLGNQTDLPPGPGPATSPSAADPTPSVPEAQKPPVPVYYVGDTPQGPRLYRYFEAVRGGEPDHGAGTVIGLLMAAPSDPDYRTLWPLESLESLTEEGGVAVVSLRDGSVRDRPETMSEDEASLAVQQVVYTVHAAFQRRVPVQFELNGNPIDQVFGVPTSEPLANAAPVEVLSLVNISDPGEGREVEDVFTASGVANSYEATVPWQILREGDLVLEGFATAEGWMGDRLFSWQTRVDVSTLDPGTYTFRATTSDPSGGEGPGPFEDTRTIVVR